MTWEFLILILVILANGAFAMSEIAVVSSKKTRLQRMADEGVHGARTALELAGRPGRFLSTVQFGITLIGIFAGAFGGVTLADNLAATLDRVPLLQPYSRPLAFGAVVLGITYLSLILGELAPKRLALTYPEKLACILAPPMRALSKIGAPAVWFLSRSTEWVMRLLRVRPSQEPPVTEEELRILIEQGTVAGVFAASERDMLKGVLRLKDRCAADLMTPRSEILWLDEAQPSDEVTARISSSGFTVFPVCRGSLDEVLGVVHAKDLLALCLAGKRPDLSEALKPPVLVPEGRGVLDLLETFRETGQHMVLVLDEYGGVAGLVTLNDVAQSVVGDYPAAGDAPGPVAVRRQDGSWLIDGLMPADEFAELFRIPRAALEEIGVRTVSGLTMARLVKVPTEGDRFDAWGLRFEVLDMDGRRVDKVLVVDLREVADLPPGSIL